MCLTKKESVAYFLGGLGIVSMLSVVLLRFEDIPVGATEGHWLWIGRAFISLSISLVLIALLLSPPIKVDKLGSLFSWILILLSSIEAVWGLLQLAGCAMPGNLLFTLTGTFNNPGPYSGYVAVGYMLCFNEWLGLKEKGRRTPVYFVVEIVLVLLLCVLIAAMSRAAWLAVVVSSVWLCFVRYSWHRRLSHYLHENKWKVISGGVMLLSVCVGLLCILGFVIKGNSALGRLFIWKLCIQAIAGQPLTGYGDGSFMHVCGVLQEKHFASGDYEAWEEYVAGIPEYAFNDYLQIAVEKGLLVLILFLAIICLAWYRSYRRKKYGFCAVLMSLSVFAFFSYPLQIPVLQVTFYAIIGMCFWEDILRSRFWLVLIVLFLGGTGWAICTDNSYSAYVNWKKDSRWYYNGKYEIAEEKYVRLYPLLKGNHNFLYEYGHILYELGKYEQSVDIVEEALELCNTQVVWYLQGMNYWKLNRYEEAEKCLIRSRNVLPIRIYSYYVLTKFYADPVCFQPEKMKENARIVLTKEPKVMSKAIEDMREKVRALLEERERAVK